MPNAGSVLVVGELGGKKNLERGLERNGRGLFLWLVEAYQCRFRGIAQKRGTASVVETLPWETSDILRIDLQTDTKARLGGLGLFSKMNVEPQQSPWKSESNNLAPTY